MRTRRAIVMLTATLVALAGCGDDGAEAAPTPAAPDAAPQGTPEPTPTESPEPEPLNECDLLTLDELASIDNALHRTPKVGFRTAGAVSDGWHVSCGYVRADAEIGPLAPTWLRITTETDEFTPPATFIDDELPMSEPEAIDDLGDEAYAAVFWDTIGRLPDQTIVKALTGTTTVELSVRNQHDGSDDPDIPDVDAVIDGYDAGCHFTGRDGDRPYQLSVLKLTGERGDEVWDRWNDGSTGDLSGQAVYVYNRDAGAVSIRTDDVYLQVRASNLHHEVEEPTAEHLEFMRALARDLG